MEMAQILRKSVDGSASGVSLATSFGDRQQTPHSLSADQALIHLIKGMLDTSILTLPMAFKYSGLWAGFVLLTVIGLLCLYSMRQVVKAADYLCNRIGIDTLDYGNTMRCAVELGPPWIAKHGYGFKMLVNTTIFVTQCGSCAVYFVFMADNLKQFFDQTGILSLSQAGWIGVLLLPELAVCSIRHLNELVGLSLVMNFVYLTAIFTVLVQLFHDPLPSSSLPAFTTLWNIPLFFGTVIYAFIGAPLVLPIANCMHQPKYFVAWNGVQNTAVLITLILYLFVGFFGYLKYGDGIRDAVILNLPNNAVNHVLKVAFTLCAWISFPIQYYAVFERVEKWISRRIAPEKQNMYYYYARWALVLLSFLLSELIPRLALFIALVGAFSATSISLVYPPIIDLLVCYARDGGTIARWDWARCCFVLVVGVTGTVTGTYAAVYEIVTVFGDR